MYEWVASHKFEAIETLRVLAYAEEVKEWVMSHMYEYLNEWRRTNMNESCRTCMNESCRKCMNESCLTYLRLQGMRACRNRWRQCWNESCRTCTSICIRVMLHMYEWVMPYERLNYVTPIHTTFTHNTPTHTTPAHTTPAHTTPTRTTPTHTSPTHILQVLHAWQRRVFTDHFFLKRRRKPAEPRPLQLSWRGKRV